MCIECRYTKQNNNNKDKNTFLSLYLGYFQFGLYILYALLYIYMLYLIGRYKKNMKNKENKNSNEHVYIYAVFDRKI